MPVREHWNKHTNCVRCGEPSIRARGLCVRCYNRDLEEKNRDKRLIQKYIAGEKQRFGGRRDLIVTKYGARCVECGMSESESIARWGRKLDIHHIDGNGRTSENPNHELDNLILLCRECHMSAHHPKGRPFNQGVAS